VSGIWTFLAGVGAVIAPLIIQLYRKRRKDQQTKSSIEQKKDENNS
jgi:hypothetical protein